MLSYLEYVIPTSIRHPASLRILALPLFCLPLQFGRWVKVQCRFGEWASNSPHTLPLPHKRRLPFVMDVPGIAPGKVICLVTVGFLHHAQFILMTVSGI